MNILIIAPVVFPCTGEGYQGIERLVLYWAGELHRLGHRVTVAAAQGSRFPRGVDWIEVPQGDFTLGELVAYGIYKRQLGDFQAILDFGHSHWAMREQGLPAMCWAWHSPAIMQPPLPSYNVCALSEYQKHQLWAYQKVVARVIDPHCGSPVPLAEPDGSFLFIGRVTPTKGCLEAVDLCREVGARLNIVGGLGPGDDPSYMDQVRSRCGGGIEYYGQASDEVKNHLLSRARALIYPLKPAYEEAHSHKSVDALLAGAGVIAYAQGALPEVIEHGVDGFLAHSREEFKGFMLRAGELDRVRMQERAVIRWSAENTVSRAQPVIWEIAGGTRW